MSKKLFIYKDCSKPLPSWPFWGDVICTVESDSILHADSVFKDNHPEFTDKKGNLKNTISVSTEG